MKFALIFNTILLHSYISHELKPSELMLAQDNLIFQNFFSSRDKRMSRSQGFLVGVPAIIPGVGSFA
jgi:hypothetical protein